MGNREWLLTEQPASRRQARPGQTCRARLALRGNGLAMVGLVIFIVSLGFNLPGDGLRDVLGPKARK
jgi:peptide/nickel transport system permease protein